MTYASVLIDLNEIEDETLIEHLENRGYKVGDDQQIQSDYTTNDTRRIVQDLYDQFTGQGISPETLRKLFYQELGRIA
jgi:DNA-binding transcriptional regulator YhcF (GntR family)